VGRRDLLRLPQRLINGLLLPLDRTDHRDLVGFLAFDRAPYRLMLIRVGLRDGVLAFCNLTALSSTDRIRLILVDFDQDDLLSRRIPGLGLIVLDDVGVDARLQSCN